MREIRQARALKQFEVGQFYLRVDEIEAAKYYFELVAREFVDTEWAGRARGVLAKIARGPKAEPKSGEKEKGS